MTPTFDVYVWVNSSNNAATLSSFIARYVDVEDPGEPRFGAFVRTFVAMNPSAEDGEALAELGRDDKASTAFSLYLAAQAHHGAIITLTEEGALVLGLSLDDPTDSTLVVEQAAVLMRSLRAEFHAQAGVGGVGLPPPQSKPEWSDESQVMLRIGAV